MKGGERFPGGMRQRHLEGTDMIELKSTYSGGDMSDSDGAWECFDIEAQGKKVGECTVKFWDDGSALIERIDIEESDRGKGFGTDAIKMISDDHGKTFIVPDNARAAALYNRIGGRIDDDLWCSLDQGFGVYRV